MQRVIAKKLSNFNKQNNSNSTRRRSVLYTTLHISNVEMNLSENNKTEDYNTIFQKKTDDFIPMRSAIYSRIIV